ncbi:SseB family protein [Spongisporangium articulatum]|uniref:SseB family protein n=1 Tax=Spongisporangium articulatum TaxID=3362603 RepID=A0ABW8AUU3_9ACTN
MSRAGKAPGENLADSAGVPWSGRTLTAQPFPGDDGSCDPGLGAALAGGSLEEVVRAWAPTRALVPIVAVLGEGEEATASEGDKSADMALVTITGADGVRSLPVFTSVAALAAWNPGARPVPVEAARAAQAAVLEECGQIVVDAAGPQLRILPRPCVWAVAQGRDWVPPAADPEVLTGVANLARAVPDLVAHRVEPDGETGLLVVLGLPAGLDADAVQRVVQRLSELLAADPVVAERAGSIRLSLRTA